MLSDCLSSAALPSAALPSTMLPIVTDPVRLSDLPALLGPYAIAAPVYVYLRDCGNISATRLRHRDEEDLILVLSPRKTVLPEAV